MNRKQLVSVQFFAVRGEKRVVKNTKTNGIRDFDKGDVPVVIRGTKTGLFIAQLSLTTKCFTGTEY